jgi:hypothetical protein
MSLAKLFPDSPFNCWFSVSAFDIKAWLKKMKTTQAGWKRKSTYYKQCIERMLAIKGDFVYINPKGDPSIELLAKKGKKFRAQSKQVGKQGDARSKNFVILYSAKDPERYRICIGYALTDEREASFWSKHYWLLDKKEKCIIECSIHPKQKYFGYMLSSAATAKMALNAKGS